MKSSLINMLPKRIIQIIRAMKQKYNVNKLYKFDKKRLLKYAYSLNINYSKENLRSKITFHYHSIEKGLSNTNLRLGFGERAFRQLFWSMDEYIKKGYPTDDYRFQSAISVISSYCNLHKAEHFSVNWIDEYKIKYSNYLLPSNIEIGGFRTINIRELPDFHKIGFKELALNRYSVRDFGPEVLDENKIYEAIDIATKTPSVCNRQSWKVRFIKSPHKVDEVMKIQNGFSGNGENLNSILLVTADKQYMNGGNERNQTYIDGGLFSMSLLYALTSLSIASCTLNTSFDLIREKKMRDILEINESEDFIVIIAIGSYPEVLKIAKSPRDDNSIITLVI